MVEETETVVECTTGDSIAETSDYTNKLVGKITGCPETRSVLETYGLKANRVSWEDTARTKGSCWGPNISDMTLCIKAGNQLMPMIRAPNFGDVTCDLPIDSFKFRVQRDGGLVSLSEYLGDLSQYTDNCRPINLTNERDTHILTSSQCCVLPCDKEGKVEFNVQMFNYQSYNDNPAVLVVLATKDGTSAQILERSNQKLFFDDNGRARNFVAERLRWVREKRTGKKQEKIKSFKEMSQEEKLENAIMVFQIPLKVKPKTRRGMNLKGSMMWGGGLECCTMGMAGSMPISYGIEEDFDDSSDEEMCFDMFDGPMSSGPRGPRGVRGMAGARGLPQRAPRMGMDMGVISLGQDEGEFIGTKDLALERDTRFPIRCTFQYYRVTDQESISPEDVIDIAEQLKQAQRVAEGQGSLVWEAASNRVTEPKLNQPKATDSPYGKLEERNYLNSSALQPKSNSAPTVNPWNTAMMANFI